MSRSHRETIVDQFTRQAVPFSTAPGIRSEEALRLIVDFVDAGAEDMVLDVACGGGIVVAAFARAVRQATGIDVTPAMIAEARRFVAEQGLANARFEVGDAAPLPFANGAFSIVTSRYAFHHFLEPGAVLAEMARVCAPGGRVMVIDVEASPDPAKAAEYDRMETLRDPSHARALPFAELAGLVRAAGLGEPRVARYRLTTDLDGLLSRSFPNPGDADRLRETIVAAADDDRLGIPIWRHDGRIHLAYPIAVLAAVKPG